MHDWGWGPGLGVVGIVGVLVMVLFWALVVTVLVLGIRWLIRADQRGRVDQQGANGHPAPRSEDALEILRQRYARGEIDDEEYQRRRTMLTGG